MAASDKGTQVQKLLSDGPDLQTREDTASLRGSSSAGPNVMYRSSREVGKNERIWTRVADRPRGMIGGLESV